MFFYIALLVFNQSICLLHGYDNCFVYKVMQFEYKWFIIWKCFLRKKRLSIWDNAIDIHLDECAQIVM